MIINSSGVNYDTDTMRTDEEINALIKSGLNGYLKKELISQIAISKTVSGKTSDSVSTILPYTELKDAVGVIFEFKGTLKVTFSSSSSYGNIYFTVGGYNSSPTFARVYGNSTNSKTYTLNRSIPFWALLYYEQYGGFYKTFTAMNTSSGTHCFTVDSFDENTVYFRIENTNYVTSTVVNGTIDVYALKI